MKRFGTVLLLLATWPLLTAGGGVNPPPAGFKITGPAVSAVIVIDPHVDTGDGSIRLQKGSLASGTQFVTPETTRLQMFNSGCDPARTEGRFKNVKLVQYVDQATIVTMFAQLGITVGPTNEPFITDVDSAVCTPDDTSGILSFTAVIQFLVPSTANNP